MLVFGYLFTFYVIISYLAGLTIFVYEFKINPKKLLPFTILLLILSPLVAWHGVLYYWKHADINK